ncbi:hypothetical protein, partial [Brevibacterium aurantiacum]|uniref:hypothetical protein n=1 Tax=Brevibacterium aurantiacum TaxID=273384 RepID=UPI001C60EADA
MTNPRHPNLGSDTWKAFLVIVGAWLLAAIGLFNEWLLAPDWVSPIEWWHSHQGLHPQKCEEPSWDPASSSAKNLTKGIPRWLT